jgi:hypothetical protein
MALSILILAMTSLFFLKFKNAGKSKRPFYFYTGKALSLSNPII